MNECASLGLAVDRSFPRRRPSSRRSRVRFFRRADRVEVTNDVHQSFNHQSFHSTLGTKGEYEYDHDTTSERQTNASPNPANVAMAFPRVPMSTPGA